jgi:hypothetical protein
MGFVVDSAALEKISLPVLRFYEDKRAMPGNLLSQYFVFMRTKRRCLGIFKEAMLFVKLEINVQNMLPLGLIEDYELTCLISLYCSHLKL